MARRSLPNNYFRGIIDEYSIGGGKTDDAKWLMETLTGSSKVA